MGRGGRQDKRIKEEELPNIKNREQQSVRTKCAGPQPHVTAWRGEGQIPACPQGRGDTHSPHVPALILAASTRDGLSPAVPLRQGPDRCWCTEGKKKKNPKKQTTGDWVFCQRCQRFCRQKAISGGERKRARAGGGLNPLRGCSAGVRRTQSRRGGGKEGGGGTKNGTKNEKCKLSFVSILARSFLQSGSHVGLVAGRESPGLSGVRSLLPTGSGLTLREPLGLCAGGRGTGPARLRRGTTGARGLSLAGAGGGGGCQGRGLPPAVGLARPVLVSVAIVGASRGADVALALGPGSRSRSPVPLETLKQKRVGE